MADPRVLVAHPSRERYGSDRQCLESVRALVAAGWDVTVALPPVHGPRAGDDMADGQVAGDLADDMAAAGARVVSLDAPVLRKAFMTPRGLVRLAGLAVTTLPRMLAALRRVRPDVVYVSTLITPLWVLAARLAGARVVVHVHEAEEDAHAAVRAALVAPLALARVVVANSGASRAVLLGSVPPRPVRLRRALGSATTVVHNGVPGPAAAAPARPALDGAAALVLVGRLSPRKGTDVAVAALAELVDGGVDATLTLVGDAFEDYAWFEAALHDQVEEAGLGDRVVFAGLAPSPWSALASADVALVPSRVEPFGNTAVEAMLAGRPLVASRAQGLAEVVRGRRDGLLVAPGDPRALAGAVREVLADWPGALERAGRAQRGARERFSTGAYASALVAAVGAAARR